MNLLIFGESRFTLETEPTAAAVQYAQYLSREKYLCGAYPFVGYCGSFLNKLYFRQKKLCGAYPIAGTVVHS